MKVTNAIIIFELIFPKIEIKSKRIIYSKIRHVLLIKLLIVLLIDSYN